MQLDKFVKSCDGSIKLQLGLDTYRIRVNQTINYKKFQKVGTEYHNVFLDEIIQNLMITSKNEYNIFYGTINLPGCIASKKQSVKEDYLKLRELNLLDAIPAGIGRFTRRKELLKEKKGICISTHLTYKCSKKLRSYWDTILQEINSDFFENESTYLIVPQQPFSQTILTTYTAILSAATNREEAMRELLYDVGFQYYYKSSYIGDLFTQSDTKNLEDAILHIKKFYIDKFKYRVKSDFELYITLNQIKEDSDQLVFDFMLIEPTLGNKYVSFTNILLKPRINDLIDRIKRKNFYLYTYSQHTTSVDCLEYYYENNYIPKIITPIKSVDSYMTLFGISKQPIKIINAYNHPNKYHTYCANFFLIQIGDKYFEISIKLTTYSSLKYDKDFFNKFEESLISNFKPKMYFDAILPASVEIYVNPVDPNVYQLPLHIYYKDTFNAYRDKLLPIIKQSEISEAVILSILWFRCLAYINKTYHPQQNIIAVQKMYLLRDIVGGSDEQINFKQFTINLLKRPIVGYHILGEAYMVDRLIRVIKHLPKIHYIMYYINSAIDISELQQNIDKITKPIGLEPFKIDCPDKTTNLEKFINYINLQIKKYVVWVINVELTVTDYIELNKYLTEEKLMQSIDTENFYFVAKRESYNNFTNFYELYKDEKFVHNIRHIDKRLKADILQLLADNKINKQNCSIHYPNQFIYQILHINIDTKKIMTIESNIDLVHNMHNIHAERHISFFNIFEIDYQQADIMVQRTLMSNLNNSFYDKDSHKFDTVKIKQKLLSDNMPTRYLDNIDEILASNGLV